MFKYMPSSESFVCPMGEVDDVTRNNRAVVPNPVSARFAQEVNYNILCAIISCASARLMCNDVSKEEIFNKISVLVELMRKNGDVSEEDAGILLKYTDPGSEVIRELEGSLSRTDDTIYGYDSSYYKLKRCAGTPVKYLKYYSDDYLKGLNTIEKSIIDRLHMACEELRKAEKEFNEYVDASAVIMINDVLTKYSDALRNIDNSWYADIEMCLKRDLEKIQKNKTATVDDPPKA